MQKPFIRCISQKGQVVNTFRQYTYTYTRTVFIVISHDMEVMEKFEPRHDKNQQNECVPSKDSDQPGHPTSLIRVFAVRSMGG